MSEHEKRQTDNDSTSSAKDDVRGDSRDERIKARGQMLLNRVKKNAKHRRKWGRRQGVTCLRLYDQDIPELPLVIDLYEERLHASVFVRDDEEINEVEGHCMVWLAAIAEQLGLDPDQIYLKTRARQRGARQYTKRASEGGRVEVGEAGLRFWVNFTDYLDTGLFLDHRSTRERVASEARGCRFLNLFAYTGSFTVYAAAAQAVETTTVDSTQTYLQWARDNLELNQLDGPQHRFVRADVREFLSAERLQISSGLRPPYDLIVLDPPTFSNSKSAHPPFDVRRHHHELFNALAPLTAPGGVLYFSNNARRFSLDEALTRDWEITEITAQTTPLDFQQRRPHRCWRCVRRA